MKKVKFLLIMIMLIAVVTSVMAVSVSATTVDQDILSFNIYGYTRYCDAASKDDYSPCYVRVSYPSTGEIIYAGAYGSTSSASNATKYNCTLDGNGNTATRVSIRTGVSYRIRNVIKEQSYSYARLGFKTTSLDGSMTISGKWSPDSISTPDYAY